MNDNFYYHAFGKIGTSKGEETFSEHRWDEFFRKRGLANTQQNHQKIAKEVIEAIHYCELRALADQDKNGTFSLNVNGTSGLGFIVEYGGTTVVIKGSWIQDKLLLGDMFIPHSEIIL